MKRIGYESYGGPEVMCVQDFTPAPLGAHDVLVTVKAAAINPIDWKIRNGELKFLSGRAFPRGMGAEFSGIVAKVGDAVSDFRVGDAVVGATTFKNHGAYADAVSTSDTLLAKKPEALSFVQATGIGVAGVTAWLALVKIARIEAGQQVLVNGALGGVGQAAVTLAKSLGAHVTGRVAPRDIAEGEALGIDRTLDYTQLLDSSFDQSFDLVFDVHGSFAPKLTRRLTRRGGVVVDINPTPAKMLASVLTRKQKILFASGRRDYLETVLDLAANGRLQTQVGQTVSFEEAIPLITRLENGQRVSGRSVIVFA